MTDPGAAGQIERVDDSTLALVGEFDLATAGALRWALDETLETTSGDVRVVMSSVTFLDSTTVGILIAARQRQAAAGRHLVLVDCSPPVRRLFEMLGLGGYFVFAEIPDR